MTGQGRRSALQEHHPQCRAHRVGKLAGIRSELISFGNRRCRRAAAMKYQRRPAGADSQTTGPRTICRCLAGTGENAISDALDDAAEVAGHAGLTSCRPRGGDGVER